MTSGRMGIPPPAAPTLTDLVTSGNNMGVYWGAVSGATSYVVDVSLSPDFTYSNYYDNHNVGNVTNFWFDGMSSQLWYVRVRSVNSGGSSLSSNELEKRSLPYTPENVCVDDAGLCTWDAVVRATSYRLDWYVEGYGSWGSGTTYAPSHSFNTGNSGMRLEMQVRACDNYGGVGMLGYYYREGAV